jgi:CheY-like chemotaxis protein
MPWELEEVMDIKQSVLVIENDPFNCMNIRQMLLALGIEGPLIHSSNGEGALFYLNQEHQLLPSLIVLDLDTPAIGGVEFLQWLRSDVRLKGIPVVVMMRSHLNLTIVDGLGITDCVVKSDDYTRLSYEIGLVLQKWFNNRPAA